MYALQIGEDQPSPWTLYSPWQSIQTAPPWEVEGVFIHDDQRLLVTEGKLSPHVICVGGSSRPAVLQTCSTNVLPMFLPTSQLAAARQMETSPFSPTSALCCSCVLCSLALYLTLLIWPVLVMVGAWSLDMPQAEAKTLDFADLMVPVSPWCNWSRAKMTKILGRRGISMPQRDM